jgi:hypothetical protein
VIFFLKYGLNGKNRQKRNRRNKIPQIPIRGKNAQQNAKNTQKPDSRRMSGFFGVFGGKTERKTRLIFKV